MCESSVARAARDTNGKAGAHCQCQPIDCAEDQTATQIRVGRTVSKNVERPRFHPGWRSRCGKHQDAGPADTTPFATNEGASSMAKRTRTSGRADRGTPVSAVNITKTASSKASVTTTPTVA